MVLGKVAHYAFDAVLISAFLAGVRRSTGLTYVPINPSQAPPNPPLHNPPFRAAQNYKIGAKAKPRPSVKPDTFGENPSAQKWFESYLWVGETVMDQSVAFFGSSSYFERKR
ncbi:hypothetical protein J4E93_001412 [Alternaria ventricosa]|uniref:uncharacterized protein n=1 Tax=Alternaria ventricosa TaxID=1187951 RepID=UPI0020C2C2D0|nr:uncharacterized protein J4E93_001412 [Alternaria ventricosa]KAI4653645.1 hypothetical protein J4E93_001412 [Alternaria ventricosa]